MKVAEIEKLESCLHPQLPFPAWKGRWASREKSRGFSSFLNLSNTSLWGNTNLSLPLEERASCYLFAALHHLQRALNKRQVTVAAAGRGLPGQASLWAEQIPWWGCTLAARVPGRAAFSYLVKIKKKKKPKKPKEHIQTFSRVLFWCLFFCFIFYMCSLL